MLTPIVNIVPYLIIHWTDQDGFCAVANPGRYGFSSRMNPCISRVSQPCGHTLPAIITGRMEGEISVPTQNSVYSGGQQTLHADCVLLMGTRICCQCCRCDGCIGIVELRYCTASRWWEEFRKLAIILLPVFIYTALHNFLVVFKLLKWLWPLNGYGIALKAHSWTAYFTT